MPNGEAMYEVPGSRLTEMTNEIARLSAENAQLKEEAKLHEEFVVACSELIPEGFDDDAAVEAVILGYLGEMNNLAGIIARLTSAFR